MNTKGTEAIKAKMLLKKPVELSLCLLMVSIVLVTFIQVLFRYVFKLSLVWTEELARYLFMWTAAISIAYAFKTKSHFALHFLVNRFGLKQQRIIQSLVAFLMVAFLVVFIWKSIQYCISVADQLGPGTGLSMAVPYASLVVGGGLMLFYIIKNWYNVTFETTFRTDNT